MAKGRRPGFNYSVIDPKIKKLYSKNKMSLNEVGRKLNIHPQIVKRRCEKMRLVIRGLAQAMVLSHKRRGNNAKRKAKVELAGRTKKSGVARSNRKKAEGPGSVRRIRGRR